MKRAGNLKRNVADMLTSSRLILAVILQFTSVTWAPVLFALAILTDAFDGVAARRWPRTKKASKSWRGRNAHLVDNIADFILVGSGWIYIARFVLPAHIGFLLLVVCLFIALIFQILVKRVGRKNASLAERIDAISGIWYVAVTIAILIIMTINASNVWPWLISGYALAGVLLVWFKRDRIWKRPELSYGKEPE